LNEHLLDKNNVRGKITIITLFRTLLQKFVKRDENIYINCVKYLILKTL